MSENKPCAIEECDKTSTARTDYCRNCNHGFSYWKRRRPAHVLARRHTLHKLDNRLTIVLARRNVRVNT